MVSRTYMQAYFDNPSLVALSSDAPCEDIAMSFLVAHASSPLLPRPPLLFKSNLTELHSTRYDGLSQGISSTVWRDKRHECVQRLMDIFARRPGAQRSFYELEGVRRRVYKLPVEEHLASGWCSDTQGSRDCRQP